MEAPNPSITAETPPELSIVLPAFNEEGNIARAVRDAFAGAVKIPMTCEVVVVNDGSRDGTARILGELKGEFGIDTELGARIHRGGYRYVQQGVRHYPRTAGRSTVRPSDVPRTLVSLARMWFRLRREPNKREAASGSPA